MAKFYNNRVKTGRLAGSVFAIRNGETIERAYQPVVANPKSAAQVASRAKLKLLSQLGQSLATVIAMPRRGMVSSRNEFTARNYEYTGYVGDTASIGMADILLTASYAGLAGLSADRSSGTAVSVVLSEDVSASWDKVCYVMLKRTNTGQITPVASTIVEFNGTNGTFPATLPYQAGDISVHAYGLRLNTEASRVIYGNYSVQNATGMARLITSRILPEGDYAVSETRGLFLEAGETTGEATGVAKFNVELTASPAAAGTVSGGGRFNMGSSVTVHATPKAGYNFDGWRLAGGSVVISSQQDYTFTLNGDTSLVAQFVAPDEG